MDVKYRDVEPHRGDQPPHLGGRLGDTDHRDPDLHEVPGQPPVVVGGIIHLAVTCWYRPSR